MEPADTEVTNEIRVIVRYAIFSRVRRVEERFSKRWITGHGEDARFQDVSMGWFIRFEGSDEALYFGDQRPVFQEGDKVKITIEAA